LATGTAAWVVVDPAAVRVAVRFATGAALAAAAWAVRLIVRFVVVVVWVDVSLVTGAVALLSVAGAD
jgi:hypothetical protein